MGLYELRIRGRLAEDWSDWFEGFAIRGEGDGITVLVGEAADSPALHGVIAKVRDLNLELLSLRRIE